jgi:hypothetical protein
MIVLISLCRQQSDHFHKEEQKGSNSYRIVAHMGCLLYLQSSEGMNTNQNSENVLAPTKLLFLLPLVL